MERNTILEIAIIGSTYVGKTCLARKIGCMEPTLKYRSTIGFDLLTHTFYPSRVKLRIWDLSGLKRFQTIVDSYVVKCSVIIFVYSAVDEESYDNMLKLYDRYKRGKLLKGKFVVIAVTKVDNYRSEEYWVGRVFAGSIFAPFVTVSSVYGTGIKKLQEILCDYAKPQTFIEDDKINEVRQSCCAIL
jgi:small GTP-binding protein